MNALAHSGTDVADRATPVPGEIVGGRYRVDRVIGEGGMGAVFAATNQLTGKAVALKWMLPALAGNPEAKARFLGEARAAARVRHPNVVDVYDVGEEGGALFLVMELLDGEPLSARMEKGPIPYRQLIPLLLPALRGIAAAHRERIVHRDLKPDNIFLCSDPDGGPPRPRVLDFGISKLGDGLQQGLTQTGQVLGTPLYMSPEQLSGARDVDARSDVYAMGVVLYEALSGRKPFAAETYPALVHAIAFGSFVPLERLCPALPAELCGIVGKAMAREFERRYASMTELIADLEAFAATQKALTDLPQTAHPNARRSVPLGTAAALLLALLALLAGTYLITLDEAASPGGAGTPPAPPDVHPPSNRTKPASGTIAVEDF